MPTVAVRVAITLAVLGCAAGPRPHPHTLAEGSGGEQAQRLVLLPLNVVSALPGELQDATQPVLREIADYLESHGKRVSTLRYHRSRKLWVTSMDAAQPRDAPTHPPEDAARTFVQRLREGGDFDAVVVPALVYREARLAARRARWDGVEREIQILNGKNVHGSTPVARHFSGRMIAVSLHVLVFDSNGERVFESYGGLDLVHAADLADPERRFDWSFRLRDDPLEDRRLVREGIALAFDPYLPRKAAPE